MNKHRVQLDFSPHALAEVDKMRDEANIATRAELIKQSLRLFYWMWKEQKTGRILIENKDGTRQVLFPYWGSLEEMTPRKPAAAPPLDMEYDHVRSQEGA